MPDSIKMLLIRLAAIAGAFAFFYFSLDWRYGAVLVVWVVMTWFILRSYDDWFTVFKRCVLSLPFIAVFELTLYTVVRPERYMYWYSTAILFDALLINVPKLLPHYIVATVVGIASTVLVSGRLDRSRDYYACSSIFLAFFCGFYLLILNGSNEGYITVLIKSFISGVLVVLLSEAFMVSYGIVKSHDLPLGYAYGFSCVLGLAFFSFSMVSGESISRARICLEGAEFDFLFEDAS
jgi:hypothetical protein